MPISVQSHLHRTYCILTLCPQKWSFVPQGHAELAHPFLSPFRATQGQWSLAIHILLTVLSTILKFASDHSFCCILPGAASEGALYSILQRSILLLPFSPWLKCAKKAQEYLRETVKTITCRLSVLSWCWPRFRRRLCSTSILRSVGGQTALH